MYAAFVLSLTKILAWPLTVIVLSIVYGKSILKILPDKLTSSDLCSFFKPTIMLTVVVLALSWSGSTSFLFRQIADPYRFLDFVRSVQWPVVVLLSMAIFGGPIIFLLNRVSKISVKDYLTLEAMQDTHLNVIIESARAGTYPPIDDLISNLIDERLRGKG